MLSALLEKSTDKCLNCLKSVPNILLLALVILLIASINGFTNIFKKQWSVVNVEDLNKFEDNTVITPELLIENGLIKKVLDGVKVLGDGNVEKKITVQAHKFSKSAVEKIESAGGKAEVI